MRNKNLLIFFHVSEQFDDSYSFLFLSGKIYYLDGWGYPLTVGDHPNPINPKAKCLIGH